MFQSAENKVPISAVLGLAITQIVGYGTLYYSFPILAPAMADTFGIATEWVFGALSVALALGSFLAPYAGRLADRHGAGKVMTIGSIAASLALAICALAPERYSFVLALITMELAACFVLYATAFVAIVQIGKSGAQRSITHLTLIAGFASTLFWPLTAALHEHLTWREIYLGFAALNLLVCLPIHAWLSRLAKRRKSAAAAIISENPPMDVPAPASVGKTRALLFVMMGGFALQGFVLSALLLHMVPLLTALGLGAAGVAAATLFGPAQVASRLINMIFGGRLPQTVLAILAAFLLIASLTTLLTTTPAIAGIVLFVVLFGLGSGLISIVSGTLPLEAFGSGTYGHHVGMLTAARQFSSAFAPFIFALLMAGISIQGALVILLVTGIAAGLAFIAVHFMTQKNRRLAPSGPFA
ncbi:arsenite efflux MFS transporter ArsK [Pelagibacterium lentulum]|uniref:MFS transporter n=1 Tax=Pelagibacterium lentulum TaxID=2029865 RepID=A0A916VXB0_9HYPH|nr:arsenite efflux MFS transporter ArsK [Pelagibacterium lentulum]GGA48027.1 MFS transporter [Pelagibacterium lentulum]